MHIQPLLAAGESKTLEFKQDASSLTPIIKSIIAFANTAGGLLLIGITDDHQLINVDSPDKERDRISNAVGDSITPQLTVAIEKVSCEGKTLLAITVQKGKTPYFLKKEGLEKGTYIRIGATTRLASAESIAEIQRQGKQVHFDAQPCLDAEVSDLDPSLLERYFHKIDQPCHTANLLSLGLLTKEAGTICPTQAGMILFGKLEKRLHLFPNTHIGCARFKGATKAIFIDKQEFDFDFFAAIEEVPKFIQRHTLTSVKFEGMYRHDIPEYPPVALREVLINAFVHANYEVKGVRFLIGVYDNRIEIQNPGIFPNSLTLEEFKAGVSRVRNPIIARVFREVGLIEEWGSGYERIQKACEALGCLQLPEWEEFSGVMRVTLYPRPPLDLVPDLVPVRDQVGEVSLIAEFKAILTQAQEPQALTEIMAPLGLSHRTKFKQKYINPLLEQGLLQMTVSDKPNSRLQRYVITPLGLTYLKEGRADE